MAPNLAPPRREHSTPHLRTHCSRRLLRPAGRGRATIASTRHTGPAMNDQTSPAVVSRLQTAWGLGVPAEASVLHARWWQLETWLRELIYVELKAKYGLSWGQRLEPTATRRATREATVANYMPTADSHHVLAYLDVDPLFKLIEDGEWGVLSHAFPPLDIWRGRADELQTIRNRIEHYRRPHVDDLARVEQTLRDLEAGALRSVAAFNR